MPRVMSRRVLLLSAVSATAAVYSAGCGTVLHPERRGQPAGDLDWKIVALNGLGLLLFFVPGVIAFAVDFNNGSIYLPPNHYGATNSTSRPPAATAETSLQEQSSRQEKLVEVRIPPEKLSREQIETVVSAHTGQPVELAPGRFTTSELPSIDGFWTTHDSLAGHS